MAGNVVRVVDQNGTVVGSYEYNAFGERLGAQDPPGGNRFQFQSNWIALKDSGGTLFLSPTRLYDASTGRFLQRDPDDRQAGSYRYASNHPTTAVDPTGRQDENQDTSNQQILGTPKPNSTLGKTKLYVFAPDLDHAISLDINNAGAPNQWPGQSVTFTLVKPGSDPEFLRRLRQYSAFRKFAGDFLLPYLEQGKKPLNCEYGSIIFGNRKFAEESVATSKVGGPVCVEDCLGKLQNLDALVAQGLWLIWHSHTQQGLPFPSPTDRPPNAIGNRTKVSTLNVPQLILWKNAKGWWAVFYTNIVSGNTPADITIIFLKR